MAQRAGRISCPRCGANNFDTVSVCWKCSAPLGAGSAVAPPVAPTRATTVPTPGPAMPVPPQPAVESPFPAAPADGFAYPAAPAMMVGAAPLGNPTAANRAAMWLGLLFPYFGLPVGLAFMMCD